MHQRKQTRQPTLSTTTSRKTSTSTMRHKHTGTTRQRRNLTYQKSTKSPPIKHQGPKRHIKQLYPHNRPNEKRSTTHTNSKPNNTKHNLRSLSPPRRTNRHNRSQRFQLNSRLPKVRNSNNTNRPIRQAIQVTKTMSHPYQTITPRPTHHQVATKEANTTHVIPRPTPTSNQPLQH